MNNFTHIIWLRNDLRLADHQGFTAASLSDHHAVVPIFVLSKIWTGTCHLSGLDRCGPHRARFLLESLRDLQRQLQQLGSDLVVYTGEPSTIIPALHALVHGDQVFAGEEPCSEEQAELQRVLSALPNDTLSTYQQRSLLDPEEFTFSLADLPPVFSRFRRKIEQQFGRSLAWPEPLPAPQTIPGLPLPIDQLNEHLCALPLVENGWDWLENRAKDAIEDPRAALSMTGGATAGQQRLAAWVWDGDHLRRYKQTRNSLLGADFSSRLSPWLANGSLSARSVAATIRAYETKRVANEDTYWLLFELLWRDYFQFLAWQNPSSLFWPQGTEETPSAPENPQPEPQLWQHWQEGACGSRIPDEFVAANLQELAATGWMSNRGRQNVASYWVHDLGLDWRWGAAWFEHCLIDFDPASNSGNWLSILGGTPDPRGGRKFNLHKQAWTYDRNHRYRQHWLESTIFRSADS